MASFITTLLHGGLGLFGSIISTLVKSYTDLKHLQHDLKAKQIEYENLQNTRLHEKEMILMDLELKKLNLASEPIQTSTSDNIQKPEVEPDSLIQNIKDTPDQNLDYSATSISTFDSIKITPKSNVSSSQSITSTKVFFFEHIEFLTRPYIAMLLCTVFSIIFGYFMIKSINSISDIESFKIMMDTEFLKSGLCFIENIVTFYFGAKSIGKK